MEARSLFATRDTENFYYDRLSILARYDNIDRSSTECSNHSMEASPLLVEEERACFLTRFLCWTHGTGIAITPLFYTLVGARLKSLFKILTTHSFGTGTSLLRLYPPQSFPGKQSTRLGIQSLFSPLDLTSIKFSGRSWWKSRYTTQP